MQRHFNSSWKSARQCLDYLPFFIQPNEKAERRDLLRTVRQNLCAANPMFQKPKPLVGRVRSSEC